MHTPDVPDSSVTTTNQHETTASKEHPSSNHPKDGYAVSGTSPTPDTSQSAPATPTPDTTPPKPCNPSVAGDGPVTAKGSTEFQRQVERTETAHHEAAHAVHYLQAGGEVGYVYIGIKNDSFYGTMCPAYGKEAPFTSETDEIALSLIGGMAEMRAMQAMYNWRNIPAYEYERIRAGLAGDVVSMVRRTSCGQHFSTASTKGDYMSLTPADRVLCHQWSAKILWMMRGGKTDLPQIYMDALELANQTLVKHPRAIKKFADVLMERHIIGGRDAAILWREYLDGTHLLNTKSVGEMLHTNLETVRTLIRTGAFPSATRIFGRWAISESEVQAYMAKMNPSVVAEGEAQ